jgi:hypothetical protein
MDTPTTTTTPVEPGIDIRKLKPETVILLEAEPYLYEIHIMYPAHGIVEISSNDPHLHAATVGQLLQSVHWSSPVAPIPFWIGKGLALEIRFRNGVYRTQPVIAATVKGKRDDGSRWSYDVFDTCAAPQC